MNEKPLSDSIAIIKEGMFLDSTTLKWATSKETIAAFFSAFPRLSKTNNQNWDTLTRAYNEILIYGKNKTYSIYWVLGNKDSLVAFDETTYHVDKTLLAKASKMLDRRIITKEIYKKDLVYYDTSDFYNRYYLPIQDTNRPRRDKMFIYILE